LKINSIIDLVKDLDTSRQTKNLNKLLIRILLHLQVEFSRYRNGALDETESRSRQSSFNIRTWPDKSSVMQNCCNVSCSAQAAGNNRIAVQMAGFTGTMGLADVKSVDWMVFQTTVLDQAHSCPL
jgi:hypothetical protein